MDHCISVTKYHGEYSLIFGYWCCWALKGNKSNKHLDPACWWPYTRVYCFLCQNNLDNYTFHISRSFCLEITLEITHEGHPTAAINRMSFVGLNYFQSYICPCCFQYCVKLDREISRVDSSPVLPTMLLLFYGMMLSLLFFSNKQLHDDGEWWYNRTRFLSLNISLFVKWISKYYPKYVCQTIMVSGVFQIPTIQARKDKWLTLPHYLRHWMLSTPQPPTPLLFIIFPFLGIEMYKCIKETNPTCLNDLFSVQASDYQLRDSNRLIQPKFNTFNSSWPGGLAKMSLILTKIWFSVECK